MLFLYIHVRSSHVHVKKLAKLLLFFDMTKFFSKKNQKKCILHAIFGILAFFAIKKAHQSRVQRQIFQSSHKNTFPAKICHIITQYPTRG